MEWTKNADQFSKQGLQQFFSQGCFSFFFGYEFSYGQFANVWDKSEKVRIRGILVLSWVYTDDFNINILS